MERRNQKVAKTPLMLPRNEYERGWMDACMSFNAPSVGLIFLALKQEKENATTRLLSELCGLSHEYVTTALRKLESMDMAHISHFDRVGNTYAAFWSFGKGKSAFPPKGHDMKARIKRATDNAAKRAEAASNRLSQLLDESVAAIGDVKETKHGAEYRNGNVRIHKMR